MSKNLRKIKEGEVSAWFVGGSCATDCSNWPCAPVTALSMRSADELRKLLSEATPAAAASIVNESIDETELREKKRKARLCMVLVGCAISTPISYKRSRSRNVERGAKALTGGRG